MLVTFAIQHRGILGTANVQKYIGLLVIVPMLIVGVVPILTGQINWANYSPLVPLAAAYAPETGRLERRGWTLVLGGMFIAAWSTYGFETAVCYTSEFKNPGRPTRSRPSSIRACCACCSSSWCHSRSKACSASKACWRRRSSMVRASAMRWRSDGRRLRVHHQHHGDADDPGADAVDHDGDGRIVAHALSGLGRRLAAALS